MNILYESGPWGMLIFLLLTIVMGGAASLAAGRALALTWRPLSHCVLYAAPIAATIAFLHYALFQENVIPLYALGAAIAGFSMAPASSLAQLAMGLGGFAVLFIIHSAFALAGYRFTRARQMTGQYKFAYLPQGLFGWRTKA